MFYRAIYRQKWFQLLYLLLIILSVSTFVQLSSSYEPATTVVHYDDAYQCKVSEAPPDSDLSSLTRCQPDQLEVGQDKFKVGTSYYMLSHITINDSQYTVEFAVYLVPSTENKDDNIRPYEAFRTTDGLFDSETREIGRSATYHFVFRLAAGHNTANPTIGDVISGTVSFTIYLTNPGFMAMYGGYVIGTVLFLLVLPSISESLHKYLRHRDEPEEPDLAEEVRNRYG